MQFPGLARTQLYEELSKSVDGPRHEIPELIDVLGRLGLLHVQSDHYHLSGKGHRTLAMSTDRARREFAELIIQSGFLHDQARQLIEATTVDQDGIARSKARRLRSSAPQLLGLLQAWPGIVGSSVVEIPPGLYALIDTPWSLVPVQPRQAETKRAVGWRAEAYSFHFLRLQSEKPSAIVWVANDDDGLGYDIENHSKGDLERIEVKGSQQADVRFFLSEHEHQVAHQDPSSYAIHFWGKINLSRNPNLEFTILREQGFPLIFPDLPAHLADCRLKAEPTKYRVTLGKPGCR